ncbi:UDP-3-O-acyl-N-acetylglucosamine deacetylase [Campylobacter geochelonis]|uniref:UDP-3-O-acyl-N-acetylglucosamine deacetylase n=1 Tax=Campylobacter geochelonis TaxID=1780362 RepID=A0A128EN71_9BACT|nr:UDP-3-O-acyl-N-acetylglucosamine deacetylase [Campylobacter geochelonis]QKF70723.1 UDP-3-O-acyl-N-acetylglucosamine deacetylase [Campylobacter geochelonis]CZE47236.1 UDP-3-O-[3-hydroxymyristoyl] N-acetylglucosamine deacetylase [Campylobacter geochelonis]CZE49417.1 UDP-3-O-[3-hydroxymyristoyl] N-acetylglucosamine deacetylase [Campylobacter geochelonis]CZE50491.1 UDP-3-O-[3-hydroxymyristoyl] N-acetylglucosamine deacetylase [Campylobacter geochelonis]
MKQTTIAKKVEGVGIGLHKGEPIKITLEPLEADLGIVFYRKDAGVSIKAEPGNVINTQMATVVGNKTGIYISTIEHLFSAINSYGIDNIRIVLDANEIPVMDGSAISFCMMLDEAGIKTLDSDKKAMIIKREVEVKEGDKFVRISPSKNPKFDYTIKFDHPIIGKQNYVFEFSKDGFIKEISRARTFGFLKDVQMLRANNLALGGSLENAVVIDDSRILNPEGLRFENEFVRHKILDAIGDLALIGMPILGDYTAFAGSHDLNHKLTLAILSDEKNYEIVTLNQELAKEYSKVFA